MKNKKLLYGILIVLAIVGIGLFMLSKPATTPIPEAKVVVKQSGGAGMLIAECTDKDYIIETSDYIIEGTVEKVESKWNKERTSIFTYIDLRIEKYVKGTPFTEDKLQIVTPGGTVGEISQWVEDKPIFHEGKKVRIYFQETNGEFSIVCAQIGVEEIGLLSEKGPEEYYGSSTYGQCQTGNDCYISGCNSEICQSKAEELLYSICILPDKPTPKQLNYGCKCVNQKCQWSK